jgi:hypothetical protein
MGRPLKKKYFGNINVTGQQIIGNAWIQGDSVARPSWIVKQLTSNSYQWLSVNGQGPATPGQCYLVNGPITGPGQANIAVYPYGGEGGGAVAANANLGVYAGTVIVANTGSVTQDYGVGNVLSLTGGTYTGNQQANVTVTSVKVAADTISTAGTRYSVGDTLTFSGAGYSTPVVLTVSSANGTGGITGVNITNRGVYTNATLPADPVASTSNVATNVDANGATFTFAWGINAFSVANIGDYTVLPANPVSLSGGGGTGATINVTYQVSSVQVTNGGSGFDPGNEASVTFGTGNATAVGVVNAAGSVTSVTVISGGSGYVARPTVSLNPISTPTLAAEIFDNTVKNFTGQTWSWLPNGNQLPGPTWAHINTQ